MHFILNLRYFMKKKQKHLSSGIEFLIRSFKNYYLINKL